MKEEPIRVISESQFQRCIGKKIVVRGTAIASKAAAFVRIDELASEALSIERNWYWPINVEDRHVEVIGYLAWHESYIVPNEPDDKKSRVAAHNDEPGDRIEGYYYLKNIEYKVIQ